MLVKSIVSATLFASAFAAPAKLEERAALTETFFPWLLIPIRQSAPDQAFGTQYTVDISYEPGKPNRVDTLVSFGNNVPVDQIKSCEIQFALAKEAPTTWNVTGSHKFEIVELGGEIDQNRSTYNNSPKYGNVVATVSVGPEGGPGKVTYSAPLKCKTGRIDYALSTAGYQAVNFHWFEMKTPTVGLTYVVNTK